MPRDWPRLPVQSEAWRAAALLPPLASAAVQLQPFSSQQALQMSGLAQTCIRLATAKSEYAVRAETEADFQAAVSFAAANDLRLVVKATGHDWYGRSTAGGSLLLWTHLRKNITWHDAFVPTGSADEGVPAVTVQSGVQFSDLYPAAQAQPYPGDPLGRRTILMGGGCDSVGVGGCWLGGCYNVFTKKFGDGAVRQKGLIFGIYFCNQ